MSVPLLGHLAGHGRERERDALNEEVGGSEWRLKFWKRIGILENEKLVVVEEGKENKKKEKKLKGKIFSLGFKNREY